MKQYFGCGLLTTNSLAQLTKDGDEGRQMISMELQRQFRELQINITSEHTRTDQLIDLREVKATIKERLQATETALAIARQQVMDLENHEQHHVRRILALETEVAVLQNKVLESPHNLIQFNELSDCNKRLQDEVTTSRTECSEISRKLQEQAGQTLTLQERLKDLLTQLDETRCKSVKIADEKSFNEAKAIADLEEMRHQVSRATSLEKAKLESNYINELQQVRQQKLAADDKAEKCKRHLDWLQAEKEESDSLAEQRMQLLQEAESQRKKEVTM